MRQRDTSSAKDYSRINSVRCQLCEQEIRPIRNERERWTERDKATLKIRPKKDNVFDLTCDRCDSTAELVVTFGNIKVGEWSRPEHKRDHEFEQGAEGIVYDADCARCVIDKRLRESR